MDVTLLLRPLATRHYAWLILALMPWLNSCQDDSVYYPPVYNGGISGSVRIVDDSSASQEEIRVLISPTNKVVRVDNFSMMYSFSSLAPGIYTLQASSPTATSEAVTVILKENDFSQVNLTLRPGKTGNKAPSAPYSPFPSDGSVITNPDAVELRWACDDPEKDPLTYEVYFSRYRDFAYTIPVAATRETHLALQPFFNEDADFFWKVIAKDAFGNAVVGPVWHLSAPNSKKPAQLRVWMPFDGSVRNKADEGMNAAGYDIGYMTDRHNKATTALQTGISETSFAQLSTGESIAMYAYQDFSVSLWIKPEFLLNGSSCIVSKADIRRDGLFFPQGWRIEIADAQQMLVYMNNNPMFFPTGLSNLLDGNWHHIVVLFRRSASTVDMYVDNEKTGSLRAKNFFSDIDTQSPLSIGGREFLNGFKGGIDDLRIYKGSLSADNIKGLFDE